MESADAGVASNLTLPEEISASKVASALPVNIVPYSVIDGVVPSWIIRISVKWYVLSVLFVTCTVNLAERNTVADNVCIATCVVEVVEVSVVSIPYSSTWSLALGEVAPIPIEPVDVIFKLFACIPGLAPIEDFEFSAET